MVVPASQTRRIPFGHRNNAAFVFPQPWYLCHSRLSALKFEDTRRGDLIAKTSDDHESTGSMTQSANTKPAIASDGTAFMMSLPQHVKMLNEVAALAITAANAVAARNSAAVTEFNQQMTALMSRAATPSANKESAAATLAFARRTLEAGVAHNIALAEIAAKTHTDALTILREHVAAILDGLA